MSNNEQEEEGDKSQVTCGGLFVPSKAMSKKYACRAIGSRIIYSPK
jgi:hypothetical protein